MITNLTPTEIESLRIAIAEECGWKRCHCGKPSCWWVPRKEDENSQSDIPPYTTSIDAIQAAAVDRFETEKKAKYFFFELYGAAVSLDKFVWQLTALDWCIAFARTAKIWRYKV